jgi:molybdate transport system regulatory protein
MSIYSEKHIGDFVVPLALRLGEQEISHRRLKLLEAVQAEGSISAAAKAIGMTYKAAWDAVDAINNLAGVPIVVAQHGGAGGGGATLSPAGIQLVNSFKRLGHMQAQLMALLDQHDISADLNVIRSLFMKTSARNTLSGTIKSIQRGAVNSEVVLGIQGNDELVTIITNGKICAICGQAGGSAESMNLTVGQSAYALIKSSFVVVTTEKVRTSARNQLCGTIERVTEGAVNSEVVIALAGGNTLTAIITEGSAESLGLKAGEPACALIKASLIILGVDS